MELEITNVRQSELFMKFNWNVQRYVTYKRVSPCDRLLLMLVPMEGEWYVHCWTHLIKLKTKLYKN